MVQTFSASKKESDIAAPPIILFAFKEAGYWELSVNGKIISIASTNYQIILKLKEECRQYCYFCNKRNSPPLVLIFEENGNKGYWKPVCQQCQKEQI